METMYKEATKQTRHIRQKWPANSNITITSKAPLNMKIPNNFIVL